MGDLSYTLPTGSVGTGEVASAAATLWGAGALVCGSGNWKVGKGEGGGNHNLFFFFKPSGLTATLSKFGQEKKCHSFEVD